MASGSSGRTGSGVSKGFDFGSDDILCSYDDLGNQEALTGNHRDPVMSSNSGKEGKTGRSSLLHAYNHQEESLNQDLISTMEKTVKKYADNLLRFLEGISSRLSQLELYCYNLEKSVGEMRSDLVEKHSEANSKLRSLEKHLQEVHRYMQILRDKQELAETQKQLAKLQLAQKESSSSIHLQHKEEGGAPFASDSQKVVCTPERQNLQLALALPHQVAVSSSQPPRPVEQLQPLAAPRQTLPQTVHAQVQQVQPPSYYPPQNHLPNPLPQTHHQPQDQYLQADTQYQTPQMHDLSRQAPQPPQPLVGQTQQMHPFPPYQQQWPQQFPRQVQPPQQPSPQPQVRPQTTTAYSTYSPTHPANPPPETFSASMPMQVSFSGVPPSGVSRTESMAYGYGGAVRTTVQQLLPPQHNIQRQPPLSTNQNTFGVHLNDGSFSGAGHHPPQPQGQGYMMYDGEDGRTPQPPPAHYSQGGYPPTTHTSLQNPQTPAGGSLLVRHPSPSQMMRSHMYSELIEKAVSMGYSRDHVAAVIHRLEESGQPVDVNSILHKLNVQSSGGSQRGWSG
ncbi:mediator of RNA polymerase II transcription subunit 15-like [Macadamia integrifolia]|uniref:mediator of RNA polymerase II transcription subunit 15-like n=1 Tax=Macadamia integrifolia TaxID=60698 RepID=UPI001C4FB2C9|nr:mediator of RNA polymerase II transcription subunit 15-like [Macadamia integrifolia]